MSQMVFHGRGRAVAKGAALALTLLLAAPLGTLHADARAGGGFSFGSRGSRTFSAPAPTNTFPRAAQPFQYSQTPRPGMNSFGMGAQPRRFGFGSGLAAGLLGAGLLGMLTGNGFFGGIVGLASFFGFLFQLLLIAGLIAFALGYFRNRRFANPLGAGVAGRPGFAPRMGLGPMSGGFGRQASPTVEITPADYAAFERTLVEIQHAFGREDMTALSRLTTPEMLRYFGANLEDNRRRGVHNDVTGVQLLQGDLSEAWREGATEYATVAMRFAGRDVMVDRTSGRVVSGDPSRPTQATEVWTFRRDGGGPWVLSGIQQTS